MTLKLFYGKLKILIFAFGCILILLGFVYRIPLWEKVVLYYDLVSDRERIETLITSFGFSAPLAFLFIQILQVFFAPIPGEATGFIGGYLFGAAAGFLLSSLALSIGSWINFVVGRFLGKRYIHKLIPADQFNRFDNILKRRGLIVLFALFVFPGFPKDYLCFFLGLSTIPQKVFLLLATIGRMPGTFMLSLQGASLFEKNYGAFFFLTALCCGLVLIAYRYRENLYRWLERSSNR